MSADVSESLDNKAKDKSVSNLSDNGRVDDESSYLYDDSDEFTDWSEDDNSQNLDEDLESNFSDKRYSGDGEEQPSGLLEGSPKQVDDDEDRKNPAYVPRKGSFFEHDLRRGSGDRSHDNGVGSRKVKEKPSEHRRRGLWSCDGSYWQHDRFDERSQRPKTVHELVTFYGFNIRKDARVTNGSKRYGTRNKIRTPLLNGCAGKRSPTLMPRKVGKVKKDSLRTFIIISKDDKIDIGDEIRNESGSQRSDTSIKSGRPLDFDDIKGKNRFIEEPIICFAPKRGEKVEVAPPILQEVKETRQSSCGDGSEDIISDSSDVMSYSGELIITPTIFQRGGGHAGMPKKKKFTAGSGRIAPVLSSSGKRFSRKVNYDMARQEDLNYSSDEINFTYTSANSVERNWTNFSRPAQEYENYRGPSPQYRGKNRFRGKYRATGRARNYYYDGTFPQDVRLIVMCGDDGDRERGDDRPEMPSATVVRKSLSEKPSLISSQGGLISDILPPITCCARTRTTRIPADSNLVYSLAKTSIITTTSATLTTICSGRETDAKTEVATAEAIAVTHRMKEVTKEDNMVEGQKVDSSEDKKGWNDRRYSTLRNDGKARNKSAFTPRFPVPLRNRIFHPNSFNNPAASSFLPAAFILPTGPIFSPQRHPSVPHSMGRNNIPPLLGLNSHNLSRHQLLALPVQVTPVPFILASSQSPSLPSGQHFPPSLSLPSHPKLCPSSLMTSNQSALSHVSSSSVSIESSSSQATPQTSSSTPSSSTMVSRPTSLFQAGPHRNTPHPKHWFRFNSKQCALLKPIPVFPHHHLHHHHQHNQFRQVFSNAMNRPTGSMHQPGKTIATLSNAGTNVTSAQSTVISSSSSSSSLSSSSSSVASSSSPISSTLAAASKLSPHAASFKSNNHQMSTADRTSDLGVDIPDNATLYEVTPIQSMYWQRSQKACPIEVRGGTVYFSPEVQNLQYKCYPSRKNNAYSFTTDAGVVYLNSDGKNMEERVKKIISIVDPKSIDPNGSSSSSTTTLDSRSTTTTTEAKESITLDVIVITTAKDESIVSTTSSFDSINSSSSSSSSSSVVPNQETGEVKGQQE